MDGLPFPGVREERNRYERERHSRLHDTVRTRRRNRGGERGWDGFGDLECDCESEGREGGSL